MQKYYSGPNQQGHTFDSRSHGELRRVPKDIRKHSWLPPEDLFYKLVQPRIRHIERWQ